MQKAAYGVWLAIAVLVGRADCQVWEHELRPEKSLAELRPRVAPIQPNGARIEVRQGAFVFSSSDPKNGPFIGIGRTPPVPPAGLQTLGEASAWDGRMPTTVEARLRVARSQVAIAAQLQVSDGRNTWTLNVGPQGVPGYSFDATEFHTFRITFRDGVANLYLDGQRLPENTLFFSKYPRNALIFGDLSSSAAGESEWQYVRWTNKEATPWQVSEAIMQRIEKEKVVVGDRPGDVEEVDVTPPLGAPAALPDGRLMFWYVFGKNISKKEQIEDPNLPQRAFARFSQDGGQTWSDPRLLFEFPRERGARTDGVILVSRSGAIHLFGLNFFGYNLKPPYSYDDYHSDLWHARSADGGQTWSPPQRVDFGHPYTGATNSVLQLRTGRILAPISRYSRRTTGRFISCVPYSDDDGITWHRPVDEVVIDTGGQNIESGACEPVAVELKDGRVWMLIRAQDGYQWETFSSDGGLHWAPPKHSRFVCTNSPVAMLRLRDGRIFLVWNNCGLDRQPGIRSDRILLAAALSADEGRTWTGYREIVRLPSGGVVAYPFLAQAADGKVIVVLGQGQRMLRVNPEFLTRTSFREDFAEGIGRWSHAGTEGVETVEAPDGSRRKVLHLRKPKPDVPAGACLNFPFGSEGRLEMSLRLEPGFRGLHVTLTDHFSLPGIPKSGCFSFLITAEGAIKPVTPDPKALAAHPAMTPGSWHDLSVAWDCRGREAAISVDGKRVCTLPSLAPMPGVCYLRLASTAAKTDESGILVRSVQIQSSP